MTILPTTLGMTQVAIGPLLVLFVLGIVVLLAAAVFIFLFIKSGPKGRWILAGLLCTVVLVLLILLVAIRMPYSSRVLIMPASSRQVSVAEVRTDRNVTVSAQYESGNESVLLHTYASNGSNLSSATTLPFEPDIYASKESAVRAVARLVAQQYKAVIASHDDVPRTLRVDHVDNLAGDDGDKNTQVRRLKQMAARAVNDVFGADGPRLDASLTAASTSKPADPDAPWQIVLHLSAPREPQPEDGSQDTGIIEGRIAGRLGQYTRQVEYVSKPWCDDFNRWRNTHDAASWILGESEDFCPSRQESVDQAMRNAGSHVREPVSRELLRSAKRQPDWLRQQTDLYRWLDDEAYHRLKAGDLQTDVFTQEFKRPYGSVYRSAVLVHVPPEKARDLLDAYLSQAGAQRVSMLRTLASAAGLLVLIAAVYGFLSAATRGYYVWSVRLATVVLAAAGAWCIMTFVR
jgi:hypothetical protein